MLNFKPEPFQSLIQVWPHFLFNIIAFSLGLFIAKKIVGKKLFKKGLSLLTAVDFFHNTLILYFFMSFFSACVFIFFIEQSLFSFIIVGICASIINTLIFLISTLSDYRERKKPNGDVFVFSIRLLLIIIRFFILYVIFILFFIL